MICWKLLILLITLKCLIKTLSYLKLVKVLLVLRRDGATQRLLKMGCVKGELL